MESKTLYGAGHSISAWSFQLPTSNPDKQKLSCVAYVTKRNTKANFFREYRGDFVPETSTVKWKHNIGEGADNSKSKLKPGKYVIYYMRSCVNLADDCTLRGMKNMRAQYKNANNNLLYQTEIHKSSNLRWFAFYEFEIK